MQAIAHFKPPDKLTRTSFMKQPLGNRERCEDLLAKRERTLLCVAGDSAQKLQESRQGKIQADISNYEYFHRS